MQKSTILCIYLTKNHASKDGTERLDILLRTGGSLKKKGISPFEDGLMPEITNDLKAGGRLLYREAYMAPAEAA